MSSNTGGSSSPTVPDPSDSKFSRQLALIRELVTATLGIAIVVTTLLMLCLAWEARNDPHADSWARTKDLLLYVNGLVGVVIGYYFGRTPTELRAETAEKATRGALREASMANEQLDHTLGEISVMADELGVPGDDPRIRMPDHAQRLRDLSRSRRNRGGERA